MNRNELYSVVNGISKTIVDDALIGCDEAYLRTIAISVANDMFDKYNCIKDIPSFSGKVGQRFGVSTRNLTKEKAGILLIGDKIDFTLYIQSIMVNFVIGNSCNISFDEVVVRDNGEYTIMRNVGEISVKFSVRKVNSVALDIPLRFSKEKNVMYLISYNSKQATPSSNRIVCESDRINYEFSIKHPTFKKDEKGTYKWWNYISIGGVELNTNKVYDDRFDYANGLSFQIDIKGDDNMPNISKYTLDHHDPIYIGIAGSIINKAKIMVLSADKPNKFSMWQKLAGYRKAQIKMNEDLMIYISKLKTSN